MKNTMILETERFGFNHTASIKKIIDLLYYIFPIEKYDCKDIRIWNMQAALSIYDKMIDKVANLSLAYCNNSKVDFDVEAGEKYSNLLMFNYHDNNLGIKHGMYIRLFPNNTMDIMIYKDMTTNDDFDIESIRKFIRDTFHTTAKISIIEVK